MLGIANLSPHSVFNSLFIKQHSWEYRGTTFLILVKESSTVIRKHHQFYLRNMALFSIFDKHVQEEI